MAGGQEEDPVTLAALADVQGTGADVQSFSRLLYDYHSRQATNCEEDGKV